MANTALLPLINAEPYALLTGDGIARLNIFGVEMQIVQPARRLSSFALTSRIGGATQDEGGKPISEGVVNRGMAIE
jgi:hypothetical protein